MKVIGIIPARYASTRFPGKPLQLIHGKSMIERVYQSTIKSSLFSEVIVATDDQRIFDHVKNFGGKVEMTSENHASGTDRCLEVLEKLEANGEQADIVINIQGDEPFLDIKQFDQLVDLFKNDESCQIATLLKKIAAKEELFNSNVVKAVISHHKKALYFSRFALPYLRGKDEENWLGAHTYYKHIGIYAFKSSVLKQISKLERSSLEMAESLEQLRWLQNGYPINVDITEVENIAIDTPEDLEKLTNIF